MMQQLKLKSKHFTSGLLVSLEFYSEQKWVSPGQQKQGVISVGLLSGGSWGKGTFHTYQCPLHSIGLLWSNLCFQPHPLTLPTESAS